MILLRRLVFIEEPHTILLIVRIVVGPHGVVVVGKVFLDQSICRTRLVRIF